MAKASDNVFPYVHVAPAAAPSSPSAGSQRLYLDSADGNKLKRKDSSGVVTTIEGASSGTGLTIGRTSYDPGTIAAYTTTSTTDVDVDATNLAVTFTVPASGAVLITLEGVGGSGGAMTDGMSWGLRESASVVKAATIVAGGTTSSGSSGNSAWTKTFAVSGLTPAASLTYKWSWKANTGSNTCRLFAGGVAGAAHMIVRSA